MDILARNCMKFDYTRFTLADINGTARGKIVPKRSVKKFIDGLQIYAGVFTFSHDHSIPFKTLDADVASKGNNNCKLVPVPETFHPIHWSSEEKDASSVAEVYCEAHWLDSDLPQPAPRYIARRMVEKLDEIGLEILSGSEFEFKIFKDQDPTNRVPLFPACEYGSVLRFSVLEDLMYYLDRNLALVGIDVENMMCEYSPGQFEFALGPVKGMKAADNAFLFKQAVTEMVLKKGYSASFMAKSDSIPGGANGAHFNFSLWDKSTGKNAFYDANASDKLTQIAKHWIAGLVKHAPAVAALCSPTINCYRRLHQPWAPDLCDWNYFDRSAFLRVKTEGEQGTYMENRVPSSAANPYIVMAATIAAGLDGIIHKMSPPSPHDTSAPKLPSTLSEAINALEEDKGLAELLGMDIVRYFIDMKKEIDLAKFGHHDMSKFKTEELNAEILHYEIKP